jgi:large subunit ribosomal protein L24
MQIKTGDTVVVIAGKDRFTVDKKGNKVQKTGKVLQVLPEANKVIVEGVNIVKKHQKASQTNQEGQIVEVEAPIDASNVMLLDASKNKPCRVGVKIATDKNGNPVLDKNNKPKKVRYSKLEGSSYEFE